jgi:hypothetical protein
MQIAVASRRFGHWMLVARLLARAATAALAVLAITYVGA